MQLLSTVVVTRRRRKLPVRYSEMTIRRGTGGRVELVVDLGVAAWTRTATSPVELQRLVAEVAGQVWGR